jgi:hypothetical protein
VADSGIIDSGSSSSGRVVVVVMMDSNRRTIDKIINSGVKNHLYNLLDSLASRSVNKGWYNNNSSSSSRLEVYKTDGRGRDINNNSSSSRSSLWILITICNNLERMKDLY